MSVGSYEKKIERKLARARANIHHLPNMKQLHPTDSLLKDIDAQAMPPTKPVKYVTRFYLKTNYINDYDRAAFNKKAISKSYRVRTI